MVITITIYNIRKIRACSPHTGAGLIIIKMLTKHSAFMLYLVQQNNTNMKIWGILCTACRGVFKYVLDTQLHNYTWSNRLQK